MAKSEVKKGDPPGTLYCPHCQTRFIHWFYDHWQCAHCGKTCTSEERINGKV